MKKNIYITPKIKVKPIDSEEILAGSFGTDTKNFGTDTKNVPEADNEEEACSKSTSMFDTDNDQLWK